MIESQMSCSPKDWQFCKVNVTARRQFAEIGWVDAHRAHIEAPAVSSIPSKKGKHSAPHLGGLFLIVALCLFVCDSFMRRSDAQKGCNCLFLIKA